MKRKNSYLTIFAMITATLFAKALGMVRGMVMAWILGDSAEAAAFAAASKIPSAVFDILLSAAILGCFIPFYNRAKEESEGAAYGYSCAFFGAATAVCAALSALGVLLAPQMIALCAPGLSEGTARLAAELLRIMFPMMIFAAGAYTLTGILQSAGSFILPAAISAVSNAFVIIYLLVSGKSFSVYALAAVYVISWLLQLLTLAVPLLAKRMMPSPRFDLSDPYLKGSLKSAPLIMAGSWLAPASVLIASFFSSFVSDTAFVTYDYALTVLVMISGIAVYGVGNYVFPSLSRLFARGDIRIFRRAVSGGLTSMTLISVPVFCAVFTLSYEGIALLYMRGSFSEELALSCAEMLRLLSPAIPAIAASEMLCRAFYAADMAKVPTVASLSAIAACVISNAVSLLFGGDIIGIALSYTAAQWVYAAILLVTARVYFPADAGKTAALKWVKLALCGAFCFAAMHLLHNFVHFPQLQWQSCELLLKITIVFIPSTVIYLLCIYVAGFLPTKKQEER